MRLESERLLLRPPRHADRDFYAWMWSDPEVVRFLGGRTRPAEEVPERIDRMLAHWDRHGVGHFTVIRKADRRPVGRVGYLLWDPERWVSAMHEEVDGEGLELEIGWTLAREYWNRGYATEAASACRDHAFRRLGRTRVVSLIAEENVASIRVAYRIGETLERKNIPGPFNEKIDLYALESGSHPTVEPASVSLSRRDDSGPGS